MLRLAICLIALLPFPFVYASNDARYVASLNADTGQLFVEACFAGTFPSAFASGLSSSHQYLTQLDNHPFRVSRNHRTLQFSAPQAGCVRYLIDLQAAKKNRQAWNLNGAWLVNNRAWLWRPKDGREISLEFLDAQGKALNVSAPWVQRGRKYLVGNTPIGWTSRTALGNVESTLVPINNQSLNVSLVAIDDVNKRKELLSWIAEAGHAVASLYGRFPIDTPQVLVVPIGKRKEAVPWAEVQRAGRPAVHLFIDQHRPISEFRQDWTLVHELSHLLLPRVDYRDRWLSEGLASYYQNVAKARAGMLTADQGWQKLRAGFAKGRRVASGSLRNSRATRHLYWGGAAYYTLADMALRERATPQTLDAVLGKLQACCLPSNRMWSAEELVSKLDELSETEVFSELFRQQANRPVFPITRRMEEAAQGQLQRHMGQIMSSIEPPTETND